MLDTNKFDGYVISVHSSAYASRQLIMRINLIAFHSSGMAALGGARIPGEVYVWVVVFLLPVNSAINPLLYTVSAIRMKVLNAWRLKNAYGIKMTNAND